MASINRKFIRSALKSLAINRPVFHSEADFQFALAYEMRQQNSELHIRPEWPCGVSEKNRTIYLDIVIGENFSPTKTVAIELKYATRKWQGKSDDGEQFNLKNHSAHDVRRYDFWLDVRRLERLIDTSIATRGYAIMLTNDRQYWEEREPTTQDRKFYLHEGREVKDKLHWVCDSASLENKKGRRHPICLRGKYTLKWESYSKIEEQEFRYLLLEVK